MEQEIKNLPLKTRQCYICNSSAASEPIKQSLPIHSPIEIRNYLSHNPLATVFDDFGSKAMVGLLPLLFK